MFNPEFFLASLSKGWRARVVAVYKAGEPVAVMYAQERVISGVPTGVVYADASLIDTLVGNPEHREPAFRVAVQILLASPRIRGLRLRLQRGSAELAAIKRLVASKPLDAQYSRIKGPCSVLRHWKYHAYLTLPDTYNQFLGQLGGTTRHNFRYYRRRFEKSGHQLVPDLSMEELRCAAYHLADKSKFADQVPPSEIEGFLKMVAATRRPLAIGLKHRNGEWLGVIGGWYRTDGAVLLMQLNHDRVYSRDSLAVVLRAYLIEILISQRLKELVIWADTGPPLSRYVSYEPAIIVHLDRPAHAWRLTRFLISRVRPFMPKRLAHAAQWIAPVLLCALKF